MDVELLLRGVTVARPGTSSRLSGIGQKLDPFWDPSESDQNWDILLSGRDQPSGNVFFFERETLSGKQNQWIENSAPGDLFLIERVIKTARSDRIFCKNDRPAYRFPDGQGPIADQLGKAFRSPRFICRRDDCQVCRVGSHRLSQFSDEIFSVVQPSFPANHCT